MLRIVLLAALATACGSSTPAPSSTTSPPTPTEPSGAAPTGSAGCAQPAAGEAMTPDQCTCVGGRVNPSRGGEQEHCAANEQELGTVRLGIEGGWCCKGA